MLLCVVSVPSFLPFYDINYVTITVLYLFFFWTLGDFQCSDTIKRAAINMLHILQLSGTYEQEFLWGIYPEVKSLGYRVYSIQLWKIKLKRAPKRFSQSTLPKAVCGNSLAST